MHFLKQTVVVKLMTVLDLLSFTHLNLLLEALSTLTKRTTKKKTVQTWQSCKPGDCLGAFLARSNLMRFGKVKKLALFCSQMHQR